MALLTNPAFYDIFGLVVFLFIGSVALFALKTKKPLPSWTGIVLLCIAISGLIVDGFIVIRTFLS